MLRLSRPWRQSDGSAVVLGWVALYTLGLPALMRERRRGEVAGDLADENLDAVRQATRDGLLGRRLIRLATGIPDDVMWRMVDAPSMARSLRGRVEWVPVSRPALALMAIVAIGAAGGLAIVIEQSLRGGVGPTVWGGWGPAGFALGCLGVLVGILAAVPWPRRGVAIMVPGVIVGFVAAPWLLGCWLLSLIALGVRVYQSSLGAR